MSNKPLTKEQIAEIEKRMREAPKIEGPLTTGEAIQKLAGSIKGMRAKGYDWEQIAAMLTAEGITVSGSTLRRRVVMPKTTAKANGSA